MGLDVKTQDKLSEILETQGIEALEKELPCGKEAAKPGRKKVARHSFIKTVIKDEEAISEEDFWKQLTKPLRQFADYWNDYSSIEESEDEEAYYLKLKVRLPKDSSDEDSEDLEISEPGELERLSADESPQVCGSCGIDLLEGDQFFENEGFYYCASCTKKIIRIEA
jgi:hypothetical protein